MTPLFLALTALLVVAQFALPRRWAFLPLLIAVCHTGNAALGDFTAPRLLILAGLARACATGSLRWNGRNPLDVLVALLSAFALLSSFAHEGGSSNPFVYRAGLVYNFLGTYLYARAHLSAPTVLADLTRSLAVILIPLAAMMVIEQRTGRNAYVALGARRTEASVREDRNRAQGPFGTPILAGTAAAVTAPLFLPFWRRRRGLAVVGLGTCLVMIVSSASSGPIGTLLLASGAVALWRWRRNIGRIKTGVILALIVLHLVKERPIWYLMALIDFVGGSTGWYRARLIDEALGHLGDWWLFGTDYTRHWMDRGLAGSPNHSDLTNYYIHLGVIAGLPVVLLLVAILLKCFGLLGRRMKQLRDEDESDEFALWCVGSVLFAHAITFLSVSYFDQMYVLFWALVGLVPKLASVPDAAPAAARPAPAPPAPKPFYGIPVAYFPGPDRRAD